MQIKIFSIPILDGEVINDEMNAFLRSKKVLHVANHLTGDGLDAYWCFCIKYLDDPAKGAKVKTDYRQLLDEPTFAKFSHLRTIRKQLAQEEGINR